jgi:hypothetical protein
MKNSNIPVHSYQFFTYEKEGATFNADCSTLNRGARMCPVAARIYDDACDLGFYIQGKREKVLFSFSHEITERAAEYVADVFYSDCGNYKAIVWNT